MVFYKKKQNPSFVDVMLNFYFPLLETKFWSVVSLWFIEELEIEELHVCEETLRAFISNLYFGAIISQVRTQYSMLKRDGTTSIQKQEKIYAEACNRAISLYRRQIFQRTATLAAQGRSIQYRTDLQWWKKMIKSVRSGIRTHALIRETELESAALDRSAILTSTEGSVLNSSFYRVVQTTQSLRQLNFLSLQ